MRQLRHVAFDPGAFAFRLRRTITGLQKAGNAGKRCPGARQALGQGVDLAVAPIADNQALIGIEYRQPARHVAEGDVKQEIELL